MGIVKGLSALETNKSITDLVQENAKHGFDLNHNSIFASDATFCAKKSALHLAVEQGTEGEVSSASRFYFAIGSAIHEVIDDALKPISIATELTVRHPMGVNGRIDNIVYSRGKFKLIDTKTCGDKVPLKIRQSHKAQLLTYVLLSGIRDASIIYMSRNVAIPWTGELKIKEIDANFTEQEIWDGAITMAESVYCKDWHVVPDFPQPQHKTIKSCGFCPFIDYCHRDKDLWFETKDDWVFVPDFSPKEQRIINRMAKEIINYMPKAREEALSNCVANSNELATKLQGEGKLI